MSKPYIITTQVAVSTPFDNGSNSYTATDTQAAIEETNKHLLAVEVTDTANATTTSATPTLLTSMTTTPAAGTYLVWFSATASMNNFNGQITYAFYVGGSVKTDSVRLIQPFDGGSLGGTTARGAMPLNGLITVNGSQAIEVRWNVNAGTGICAQRTLNTLRIT